MYIFKKYGYPKSISIIFLLIYCLNVGPHPAKALTADELTTNLTNENQVSYFFGALDMYAFLHSDRALCALDWWHENEGLETTYAVMEKYSDKPAAALLYVLIKRQCGPSE